ncbi:MAG: sugar ABC transporter permease, partial [Clostridiales bacterium]|nr:sugar ABC transporter permease [Clostridiales bacterium]
MNSAVKIKKTAGAVTQKSFSERAARDFKKNWVLYLLVLPVIAFYVVFHYMPMYGVMIAFKNYSPGRGIWDSAWIGFGHFASFFKSMYFGRVFTNTLRISVTNIIFGFSAPIVLALLINEIKSVKYSRVVQTVTYLPHFISLVVVCGMLADFTDKGGIVT